MRPEIPRAARHAPGKEATGEDSVSRCGDAELGERGEDRPFRGAADQRVLDLQITDRVHLRGAADGIGADLGETDVADVARLHHLGDGADGILDGHRRIETRWTVDVDVIDAEPRQAVREEVLRRRGPCVVAQERAVRAAQSAELDAQQGLVPATAGKRPADEQLVLAHGVEVAGVDEVHAAFERGVDRRDPLRLIAVAVHAAGAHPHAAESEWKNFRASGSERGLRRGGHAGNLSLASPHSTMPALPSTSRARTATASRRYRSRGPSPAGTGSQ